MKNFPFEVQFFIFLTHSIKIIPPLIEYNLQYDLDVFQNKQYIQTFFKL